MHAVISDRGRQAIVRVGDVLVCDLNDSWNPGDTIAFEDVLLVSDEGEVKVGTPKVAGARVTARVIGEQKGDKVVAFRFKRRKNVRVKRGYRHRATHVEITGIEA